MSSSSANKKAKSEQTTIFVMPHGLTKKEDLDKFIKCCENLSGVYIVDNLVDGAWDHQATKEKLFNRRRESQEVVVLAVADPTLEGLPAPFTGGALVVVFPMEFDILPFLGEQHDLEEFLYEGMLHLEGITAVWAMKRGETMQDFAKRACSME
jgi:hypothetical protein